MNGKLGQQKDNGFDVIDAGVKIFEKKAKEIQPEATTISADATPVL